MIFNLNGTEALLVEISEDAFVNGLTFCGVSVVSIRHRLVYEWCFPNRFPDDTFALVPVNRRYLVPGQLSVSGLNGKE